MKVAVVHPHLQRGGSEARALWMTEALKDAHDVTIVTSDGARLPELNAAYGTAIAVNDVHIIETGLPWALERLPVGDALKANWFHRCLRKIAPQFDLVLSTYNLVDVDTPTIQFIADFAWDDDLRRKYHSSSGLRGLAHRDSLPRRAYLKFAKILSGGDPVRAMHRENNLIVANSRWTANILQERYDINCSVIYPPVVSNFPTVPFQKKKSRFVCIGRVSPEKELEKVIAIVKKVRKSGYNPDLHIIGDWKSTAYGKQLVEHANQQGDWIHFEGDCRGEKKADLLANSKFGIHGCTGEAFGIAVAEMVKAGCITFAPTEGGPAEIVDDERQLYQSKDDAVAKICRVLHDEFLQTNLYRQFNKKAEQFSEGQFNREIQLLVVQWANR